MDLATSLACLEQSELHVIHAWNLPYEERITGRGVITPGELNMWLQRLRAE